ncbi:MAG TPA: hypothetical protein VF171_05600 [Trueperaceae bacterium]
MSANSGKRTAGPREVARATSEPPEATHQDAPQHDSNHRDGNHLADEQGRNPLARAATWVSALLILAILAVLFGEALHSSAPPSFEVRLGQVHVRAGNYYVPLEVFNRGGQSVEALSVAVRLQGPGGTAAESIVSFDWLPAHSNRQGTAIFALDPSRYRVQSSITGYTLP